MQPFGKYDRPFDAPEKHWQRDEYPYKGIHDFV